MLVLVEIFVQRVRRVDRRILFSGIFACVLQNDLGTARVLWKELRWTTGQSPYQPSGLRYIAYLCHIVRLAVDDHPAGLSRVVFCDFFTRQLGLLRLLLIAVHPVRRACSSMLLVHSTARGKDQERRFNLWIQMMKFQRWQITTVLTTAPDSLTNVEIVVSPSRPSVLVPPRHLHLLSLPRPRQTNHR